MEYGLIGGKVAQSYSKVIHESFADYAYDLKALKEEELDSFMREKNFKAINVTIPYKEKVINYLDEIDINAEKIGAVNVVVNKNGMLKGYNSDYDGLKLLIQKNNIVIQDKRVVILGTGGTSKTAYTLLSDLKAKEIIKVSRSKKENVLTYDELYSYNPEVIINTTPVGMYPNNDEMPVDLNRLTSVESVVDVIANPLNTKLLVSARNKGLKYAGGLYMLVAQAVKASEYFVDKKIDEKVIDEVYQKLLRQKENIALIGMPGCGKSTIANKISENYIDTDLLIEEKENRKIADIFKDNGEKYFRELETKTIKEVSALQGKIISTGGGVVLNKENIDSLRQNSKIIYIKRDLEKICTTSSRPLSSNFSDLKKRYEERKELYEQYSDYVVENNKTLNECVKEIVNYEFSNH